MSKSTNDFRRKPPKYKPQPRILVICEDSKSSRIYLEEAAMHFKAYADIKFHHCGCTDPLNIVKHAASQVKKYDKVMCVIDRDTHDEGNLTSALSLAQQYSIDVQISYPCFEYWYLLHYSYTRKPYISNGKNSAADNLVFDLIKLPIFKSYNKGDTKGLFKLLGHESRILAMENGKKSLEDAAQDSECNPSTPTHKLMELLEALGFPQPV